MAPPADAPVLAPLEQYLSKKPPTGRRVLSIQSHVVHGHVGNKCALFPLQVCLGGELLANVVPLQLHGYEVDSINSVQFSNHTQYKEGARGQRLNRADVDELFAGLRANRLERNYSHVLTGYCGDASFLRQVASIVRECRQHQPGLIYVCDPVLGDNGKYYVPSELRDIYRDELLPLADVITPNAFELGELTGTPVDSEEAVARGMRQLLSAFPRLRFVVCSSALEGPGNPTMRCYGAEKVAGNGQKDPAERPEFRLHEFRFPKIEGKFVGTGDLFSALILTWMDETGSNLVASVRAALATMQAVLGRTAEHAQAVKSSEPSMADNELQLVQSRLDILLPKAETIEFVELKQ